MEFSPEITLAALDEVVRPSPRDIGRFGLGNAYAESKARHLMASTHSDLERAPRDLSAIDKALRAWIADGPDTDTDEHRDQAYALHQLIADQDGPYVASAWLIGMNPHLGNDSPLNAIRNGRGVDAREASRTYLDG